jgi:hypothetical protein
MHLRNSQGNDPSSQHSKHGARKRLYLENWQTVTLSDDAIPFVCLTMPSESHPLYRGKRTDGQGRGFGVIRHYPGTCLVGQRKAGLSTGTWTRELLTTVQWRHTLGSANRYRLYPIAINMAYFWINSNILGFPKQNAFRTGCVCIIRFSNRGLYPAGPRASGTFRVTCSPSSLRKQY